MVNITEIFGYVASFFVAISLLMSSFLWLRVLNLIGAVAFVVYGLLLGSIPVVITNSFIVFIDVFFLLRMLRPDLNGVRYMVVGPETRNQLDRFVQHHLADIQAFFPDFSPERLNHCFAVGGRVYLAMKELRIVGFSMVHPVPEPGAEADMALRTLYGAIAEELFPDQSKMVPVDYIIRKYRGLGLVQQLYRAIEFDEGRETRFLLVPVRHAARAHRRFLQSHGFSRELETEAYAVYAKPLPLYEGAS